MIQGKALPPPLVEVAGDLVAGGHLGGLAGCRQGEDEVAPGLAELGGSFGGQMGD